MFGVQADLDTFVREHYLYVWVNFVLLVEVRVIIPLLQGEISAALLGLLSA